VLPEPVLSGFPQESMMMLVVLDAGTIGTTGTVVLVVFDAGTIGTTGTVVFVPLELVVGLVQCWNGRLLY